MLGKGKRPPLRTKTKFTWDLPKIKGGEKMVAWVAGPHIGVMCHEAKKPKACLKAAAGDLNCPGCHLGQRLFWFGFLPIYAEPDKHEYACGFHEEQVDTLDSLKTHDGIIVGREEGFGRGLWVRRRLSPEKYQPSDPIRQKPRCIASWLPTIWGYVGRVTGAQLLADDEQAVLNAMEHPVVAEQSPPTLPADVASELASNILASHFNVNGEPMGMAPASATVNEIIHRRTGHLNGKPKKSSV